MNDATNFQALYSQARYIKLGTGSSRVDRDCINSGTAYIGFGTSNHDLFGLACKGKWDAFWELTYNRDDSGNEQARKQRATSAVNQVKAFFEADERTLWVTFYGGKLYYGSFSRESHPEVDITKRGCTRSMQGGWLDKDANGAVLKIENLSGNLTKVRGFQGTSCSLSEDQLSYLMTRLSGNAPAYITQIDNARELMFDGVLSAIRTLGPKDFELLVEIIFSQNWRRIGQMGGSEKYIDIVYEDRLNPARRFAVQVKSETSAQEIERYCSDEQIKLYEKLYYVFHTPDSQEVLEGYEIPEKLEVVDGLALAGLVVDSGLIHWLKEKTS
jgi:hypothetical protein